MFGRWKVSRLVGAPRHFKKRGNITRVELQRRFIISPRAILVASLFLPESIDVNFLRALFVARRMGKIMRLHWGDEIRISVNRIGCRPVEQLVPSFRTDGDGEGLLG